MAPISSSSTCCIAFSFRIVGSFRFVGSCKGPPSRHKDGLAGVGLRVSVIHEVYYNTHTKFLHLRPRPLKNMVRK